MFGQWLDKIRQKDMVSLILSYCATGFSFEKFSSTQKDKTNFITFKKDFIFIGDVSNHSNNKIINWLLFVFYFRSIRLGASFSDGYTCLVSRWKIPNRMSI